MLIRATEDGVFAGFATYAHSLGQSGFHIGLDVLNTLGPQARKETVKAEAKATGLSTRILGKALHGTKATASDPAYSIFSAGGEISLRHFGAVETREGVSARVLGERKTFAGTFLKAGSFAKGRIGKPNWNGQVFRRTGGQTSGWRPKVDGKKPRHMDQFEVVRSGVVIPREMIKGEPLRAFEIVSAQFPGVVLKRLTQAQLDMQARGKRSYGRAIGETSF